MSGSSFSQGPRVLVSGSTIGQSDVKATRDTLPFTQTFDAIRVPKMIKSFPLQEASSSSSSALRSAEEEDNSSICCDIYIADEQASANSKSDFKRSLQVAAVLRAASSVPNADSPLPGGNDSRDTKKLSRTRKILIALVLLALISIIIGVGVGVARQRKHKQQRQPGVVLQPSRQPAFAPGFTSVTITVPFAATASIPLGQNDVTCNDLFGEQKLTKQFVSQLSEAHSRRLAQYHVDEVRVNELQCNSISYPVWDPQAAAAGANTAAVAVADSSSEQQQQQQQDSFPSSSSGGRGKPLTVYVQLEVLRREQHERVPPLSSYVQWVKEVSAAGAAAAKVLLPEVLALEFKTLPGTPEAVDSKQFYVEIASSQVVYGSSSSSGLSAGDEDEEEEDEEVMTSAVSDRHATRKSSSPGGAILVTRTMMDPITGRVTDSHTMRLPDLSDLLPDLLPFGKQAGDTTAAPGSSSSSSGDSSSADSSSSSAAGESCVGDCKLPNALATCVNGTCQVTACSPGWQDCDANSENGCEANVLGFFSDKNHCGGCNKVCLAPLTCFVGKCSIRTMSPQIIPVPTQPSAPEEPKQQQPAATKPEPTTPPHPDTTLQPPLSPQQQQQEPQEPAKPPAATPLPQPPSKAPPQVPEPRPAGAPGPTTTTKPELPEPSKPAAPSSPTAPTQPPTTSEPTKAPGGQKPLPPAVTPVPPKTPAEPTKGPDGKPAPPDVTPVPPKSPAADVEPAGPGVIPAKPRPPVAEPTAPVKPSTRPPLPPPKRPGAGLVQLRDDVVRISPSEKSIILDVVKNDDLKGGKPSAATLRLVGKPATGSVTVLSATADHNRPRLLYEQNQTRLEPGQEVELYYTVDVPGQPSPAPATALVLGSAAPSQASLSGCSPVSHSSGELTGKPVPGLSRKDDASAPVVLPFAVTLYGVSYKTAVISSNGWVAFGEGGAQEPCNVDGSWPGAACLGTGPVIAPFWDDLIPDEVLTHHDIQLGAYIIQWTNVMFPSSALPLGTFQAFIFPNGTVGFVYRDLYGTDQALGSSAVAGIRGPTVKGAAFMHKLNSSIFTESGFGSDAHGTWLFSAAVDDPTYITTLGSHSRFLSQDLAVISHPTGAGKAPGKFAPWNTAAAGSAAGSSNSKAQQLPLLMSPDAPKRPVLLPMVAGEAVGTSRVVALTWKMPSGAAAGSAHPPTFFKLYLAADPEFNELFRLPDGAAFKPDIPGSSRSVDVVIDGTHTATEVYALLLACNAAACSRACVGHFPLA